MRLLEILRRHGLRGLFLKVVNLLVRKSGYARWRIRGAPVYANPTADEWDAIEAGLDRLGVVIEDFSPSAAAFKRFQTEGWFHEGYHGGRKGGVWDEKLLEHWLSSELLGLMGFGTEDVVIDVAAASSPWAESLRERKDLTVFAIDQSEIGQAYQHLPYYRVENATQTAFEPASVKGASLHCAYEMFMGEDDRKFIHEAARILKPGGKVVILPLYMHTHYCAYSTPEYFGRWYSDPRAKEYARLDCYGVPSSRKYDAATLKSRVLDEIVAAGMRYRLLALRNKHEFGDGIYCHLILEIER